MNQEDNIQSMRDQGIANLVNPDRPMPTKLSEWLRVAVEDTRRIPEECSTPEMKFVPDMRTFGLPGNGHCSHCMAGFALLGTGQMAPGESHPKTGEHYAARDAIDSLRTGDVSTAYDEFTDGSDEPCWTERVELAASAIGDQCQALRGAITKDGPTNVRASDESYLELADALAEMGL